MLDESRSKKEVYHLYQRPEANRSCRQQFEGLSYAVLHHQESPPSLDCLTPGSCIEWGEHVRPRLGIPADRYELRAARLFPPILRS